ncbi:MAG: hypothetical protein KGJ62_11025 [Armatimonadetes bacterium]|nr:hypothetical protein [Armatimonadota bacterium]MDE2206819.1 hypothetical protein [Armatimonadota bacterium]
MPEHHAPVTPIPGARYEERDIDLGAIIRWVIGLFVAMGFSGAVALGIYHLLVQHSAVNPYVIAAPTMAPPAPVIQAYPLEDIRQFRLHEDHERQTYKWVNQQKGVVRIPIATALAMVAAEGPAALTSKAASTLNPPAAAPEPSASGTTGSATPGAPTQQAPVSQPGTGGP